MILICANAWGVRNRAGAGLSLRAWGSEVGVCMEACLLQEITPGRDVGVVEIVPARMYTENRISIPSAKTCPWNLGENHLL